MLIRLTKKLTYAENHGLINFRFADSNLEWHSSFPEMYSCIVLFKVGFAVTTE